LPKDLSVTKQAKSEGKPEQNTTAFKYFCGGALLCGNSQTGEVCAVGYGNKQM
jgi:hypothetical protein